MADDGKVSRIDPGVLKRVMSALGLGEAPDQTLYGQRLAHFPDAQDVAFARQAGVGYGTGNEPFIEGKVSERMSAPAEKGKPRQPSSVLDFYHPTAASTDPANRATFPGDLQTAQRYAAAQVALSRSPIAAIGFDPRKISLDTQSPERLTVNGMYDPKQDSIYSSATSMSNMVHESTHRGLEMMRKAGLIPKELEKRLPPEESIVRYIMALHMGDPEKGTGSVGDRQRSDALYAFGRQQGDPQQYDELASTMAPGHRAALNELNDLAARYIAKQRPGGPR